MPLIPKAVQPAVVSVNDAKADPNSSLSPITNTVARPGILTTEWWTLIVAGVTSAAIGIVGVSNNTATQIATTAAPVAVALIYAFVRGHTKGALADVLQAVFPEAGGTGVVATGAQAGTPGYFTPVTAALPLTADAVKGAGVVATPTTPWVTGQYVPTGDLGGAYWNGTQWTGGKAP